MKALRIAAAAILLAAPGNAQEFRVDPSHASVGFRVAHLGIASVRGTFNDVKGQLSFDAADPTRSTIAVQIAAASVDTNVQRRDDDLRSENYLDVARYPDITLTGRRIERKDDRWVLTADLMIHGVTREVSIPFTFTGPMKAPGNIERIGVEGGLKIDRRDFGLVSDRAFDNALVVGNEIEIHIHVEFGRQLPAAS